MKWKNVRGYEGYYQVSNLGHVKRVKPASGTYYGKLLKPIVRHSSQSSRKTYPCVTVSLSKDGKLRIFHVSRLVAAAFIGPCPAGLQVNHKDGDTFNNASWNLEYVTNKENAQHAVNLGLYVRGVDHLSAKIAEDDVRKIRCLVLKGWTMQAIADKYKLHISTVWAMVHRKTWKHVT